MKGPFKGIFGKKREMISGSTYQELQLYKFTYGFLLLYSQEVVLYSNLLYRMGNHFLDRQYYAFYHEFIE